MLLVDIKSEFEIKKDILLACLSNIPNKNDCFIMVIYCGID